MDKILVLALTSAVLFILIIAAMRLLGKKGLSELSIVDFVLVLLISRALNNDQGFAGGVGIIISLTIVCYILDISLFKSKKFRKIIEGEPVILINDGKMNHEAMKSEKLTVDEIMETLRENGMTKVAEVKWAILETDGNISVIPKQK